VTCVDSCGTSWSRPTLGATVTVRYDPRDPDNADADRGQRPVLGQTLAIASGCAGLAILAGVVFWR
jgi:hypothetical protein